MTTDAQGGLDETESNIVVDESLEDDEGLIDIGESSLNYFGADFDVAGLVRRLEDEDIVVPRFDPDESEGSELAGFQRQRVWTGPRMEKFIESLLLGWPVPSIFLVLEPDQRYLVLDGQQRLTALQSFYNGTFPDGRKFVLKDVAEHIKGATYATLNKESKRRLNNTFIQATVIEPQGEDGRESVYRLFGRLNSGGVILTPQEIRVALYRGPVIDWIRDLNQNQDWRNLFGPRHKRLKDHELILRAMALREVLEVIGSKWDDEQLRITAYRPPMSDFLNTFLRRHRYLDTMDYLALTQDFASSCSLLMRAAGRDAIRFNGSINAAHVDAILASLMYLNGNNGLPTEAVVKQALHTLRTSATYADYVTRSTSHRDSVYGRLRAAVSAFAGA